MKNVLILLLLAPIFAFAQNPFSTRTDKNPRGVSPDLRAEIIDGRLSNEKGSLSPSILNKASLTGAKTIHYKLKYAPESGLPIWLEVFHPKQNGGFGIDNTNEALSLNAVLKDLPSLFNWDVNTTLKQVNSSTDNNGIQHVKYQQFYKNIKVNGGEWLLHVQNGIVLFGNGRIYPSKDIAVTTKVTTEAATKLAEEYVYKHIQEHHISNLGAINRASIIEKVIDFSFGESLVPNLVYTIEVRPTDLHHFKVWINANRGEIIKTLDLLCSIDGPKTATAKDLNNQTRNIKTYQKGSTYYLIDATKSMYNAGQSSLPDDPVGAIWTINANNTAATSFSHVASNNNTWSDKSSVSAHYNAGLAFDYFKNTHSRNSINGSGGTIISVVNVADQGGGSLENAYWNGQAMFYGNGGSAFKPLAGALDVAGHELTHGVVSNSANLEYEGQSGAINESMADIFGAMIDRDDWKMGEDITNTSYIKTGALRDLQNPHNGGNSLSDAGYQPAKMGEYYTGSQDNYGVHINSGIVNKAYYLIATDISKTKAEKIYYRALTVYLTSKSQFLDLRYAVEKSADDLYGESEVSAVKTAFDAVEIYDPNAGSGGGSGGSGGESDIPSNPGDEFIISVDVDASNPNTIYRSTTTAENWLALSQKTPKRKVSVTDKGDYLVLVSDNNILYRIQLTSPYTESQLSNDLWDNAAISKDGNLLAAVTTEIDSSIWVYNFTSSGWKQFKLYNPTYSEGVNGGNVLYADAIEFDNTGQYILYDARNIIESATGADIDYWDVGVIRVWNNDNNAWGDGKVDKIFTQLPEDISIGNATYAKNSPYIIAFDYIDGGSGDYAVLATNTTTNTTGTVFEQNQLGYPNFSNNDDNIIFDAKNTSDEEVIGVIDLASTKISAKSGASGSVLIPDGKWGVWYANGTRNLLSDEKEMLSFAFPGLSNNTEGVISGTNITLEVPGGTNISSLTPTFTNSADATVTVSNQLQVSGVTSQNYNNTVAYKVTAQDGTSKTYNVKVTVIASINDVANSIKLYPNPASNRISITSSAFINKIECYSVNGLKLFTAPTGQTTLSITDLPRGIYFLQIQTEKGLVLKRFSKQ